MEIHTHDANPQTAEPAESTPIDVPGVRGRARRGTVRAEWGTLIGPAGRIKIVVLGVLLLILFLDPLLGAVGKWYSAPDWSHGFLIPLFSLYFLHQRRDALAKAPIRTNWLGLVLILVFLGGYIYSIYPLQMGYTKQLAFLGVLGGTVLLCCGWRVLMVTWLPILYLIFAMPIPVRIYRELTGPMRRLASEVSAVALNFIPGMEVEARGVVLDVSYNGQQFPLSVAEACSGMRLTMAFLALGVAMAYLSDRPTWHRVVLVLITLPTALFCNCIRVTLTGVLYVLVDPIFASGTFHTVLGLLMLPLAFGIYWLVASVLGSSLYLEEPSSEAGP
jgi:exosortase